MESSVTKSTTGDDACECEVFGPSINSRLSKANIGTTLTLVQPLSVVNKHEKSQSFDQELSHTNVLSVLSSIVLRVILGLATCICLIWMTWLVILNIDPNGTVNYGMNTEKFENGAFWLLVDPPKTMLGLATSKFCIVFIGYSSALVRILTRRGFIKAVVTRKNSQYPSKGKIVAGASDSHTILGKTAKVLTKSLAEHNSSTRRNLKLWMKVVELTLQTMSLYQHLESGNPLGLIIVYTIMVVLNALTCAAMMFVPIENMRLQENLVDTLFNFLVAIGYPMFVLEYCRDIFSFDRAKYAINLEVFPPGYHEQSANAIADPVERAIIYKCLKGLRILSVMDFLTHTGISLVLCFQMHCAVDVIKNPKKQRGREYPHRSYWGAALLTAFAVLLLIFVEESVRTSSRACNPHPECAVNAHRWLALEDDSLTQCPCIILIDRNPAPATVQELQNPKDMTDKVAQLATSGDLQTLELINRNLISFPDELRGCKFLNYLSLWYANTKELPSWVGEFTHLEYLHIDNKETNAFSTFPEDMLDNLGALTYLHLGSFLYVEKLPSLQALSHLKSLTLAAFISLQQLPSFDGLGSLEQVVLAILPSLHTLPDFTALKKLKSFAVVDRGSWCCNGFLGACNLTDPGCMEHPIWHTPASSCLASNQMATPATLETVTKYSRAACGTVVKSGSLEIPPTVDAITFCNGTMYKQCDGWYGNPDSMCYSSRFMAIGCSITPYPAEMRRLQIARGVGDKCDPEVEAWLGCK